MIDCKDCVYFKRFPGGTTWKRKTGCYHPDHMEQKQSDAFLREQEVPGNHAKINLRGDCSTFELRAVKRSMLTRLFELMRA